jgi:hypothetical protein
MSDLASLLEITDGVTAPVVAVYAPCPFCNGDMEPRFDYGRIRYEHTASRPDCADCAGFALYFYSDDPAQVAAWNRRSHPIKAGEAVPMDSSLVERLRGPHRRSECGNFAEVHPDCLTEAADRISTLERELARMGEALKPFASEAGRYGAYGDGSQRAWLNCTVADLRAARSALQSTPTSDRS